MLKVYCLCTNLVVEADNKEEAIKEINFIAPTLQEAYIDFDHMNIVVIENYIEEE